MGIAPETLADRQSFIKTTYYWVALLVALILADDATFGWIFWALSQVHLVWSAAAALAIYWSVGYWVTLRGLNPEPGRLAGWLLNRLQLERKNPELFHREMRLKQKLTSVAAAIPMTVLFGGVLTTLWLYRQEVVDYHAARKLAFWLAGLYALEFALIHALGIGGSIFWARQ